MDHKHPVDPALLRLAIPPAEDLAGLVLRLSDNVRVGLLRGVFGRGERPGGEWSWGIMDK